MARDPAGRSSSSCAGIVHAAVPWSTPAGTSPPLLRTTFSSRSGVSSISGMPRGTRNQRDGESRAPRGLAGRDRLGGGPRGCRRTSGCSQPHGYVAASTTSPGPPDEILVVDRLRSIGSSVIAGFGDRLPRLAGVHDGLGVAVALHDEARLVADLRHRRVGAEVPDDGGNHVAAGSADAARRPPSRIASDPDRRGPARWRRARRSRTARSAGRRWRARRSASGAADRSKDLSEQDRRQRRGPARRHGESTTRPSDRSAASG